MLSRRLNSRQQKLLIFSVLIAKLSTVIQSSVLYIALFRSATEDQDTVVQRYKDTGGQNTNKMEKEKFSFYRDWQKSLKNLPDSEKLELYNAIVDYGLDGVESAVSPIVKMAMTFVKAQIDRNNKRIAQNAEMSRANGKLGGRPPKNRLGSEKPNRFQENQTGFEKPNRLLETKQVIEKPAGNQENQLGFSKPNNININNNDNNNIDIKEDKSSSSSDDDPALEDCISYKEESIDIAKFIEFWNTSVQGSIIPSIKSIEGERRGKLNARLKQYGKTALFEAVNKVAKSDFLKGNVSDKGWHATFDWFICPRNFAKVIEGNYDNTPQVGLYGNRYSKDSGAIQQGKEARQADALARINRLLEEGDSEAEVGQDEISNGVQSGSAENTLF